MEKINTHLLDDVIDRINKILNNIKSEDIMYVGITILRETCKKSVNVECKYDLSKKSHVLYNLRKKDLEELVGRTFLGVIPYFHHYSRTSRIPYDHLRYLEDIVKLIIEEFPHYKNLKESKVEIEKLINHKLGNMYQTVGSEILRKLEEMNMIEIIKTEKNENSPVYVRISDKAYEFIAKYEEYRTTDLEYEHEIMEYD